MKAFRARWMGILGIWLWLAGGASVNGQTIVQRVEFGPTDFDPALASTTTAISPTFAITFNRFDPALGTLTGLTVNYSFTFGGAVAIGPSGGSASLSGTTTFLLDSVNVFGSGFGNGTGGPPNFVTSFSASLSGDLGPDGASALDFNAITGTGQSTLALAVSGSLSVNSGTTADVQLNAGFFELTYTYTPSAIPEPGTWTLLAGVVACGFACFRRRNGMGYLPTVDGRN